MSLLIARNTGANDRFAEAQADIISISTMDVGIGFNEASPVIISGINCIEVTYARTETGLTAVRLDDLVHDTGFTAPEQIIVLAVPDGTTFNGIVVSSVAGIALDVGDTGNPFPNDICTIYDADDCNGAGHWVDREGGGTTSFPRDVILYHELSHCFHFATGVATSEPLAETDENVMRDARGLDHRDITSHNGGCGGGPTTCCIVASLATGSPYSEEIRRFRYFREQILRHSTVGDDFFNEFHYRYYSFSPEMTRLMGHYPSLSPLIKKYFVIPLLAGIEMLLYYAENHGKGLAKFLNDQSSRKSLVEIYKEDFLNELFGYLKIIRNFDNKEISQILNNKCKEYPGFNKMLRHIYKEAFKDEYINWSLVSVVEIWVESALLLYSKKSQNEIDIEINKKIIQWIGLLPVSNVWEEFSRLETELELKNIEQFIYDTRSKISFAKRLIEKHPRHQITILNWVTKEKRSYD